VRAPENKIVPRPDRKASARPVPQSERQLCRPNDDACDSHIAGKPSRIWWWFVAILVLQAAVWTTWLVFASHHPVEEVPLAGR
jgi:hypothetical protein